MTISSINRDEVDPASVVFCTLTYPRVFPRPRESKRHLKNLRDRIVREFGPLPFVWKLEPQKRGAPHFHLLLFTGSPSNALAVQAWMPRAWFEIAGAGDDLHLRWHLGQCRNRRGEFNQHCCQVIRSWEGVTSYADKYVGKVIPQADADLWDAPGRFWGWSNYDRLPSEQRVFSASQQAAISIRRTLRRYLSSRPSGRYRVTDPDSGRVRRLFLDRHGVQLYRSMGFDIVSLPRRMRSRGGRGGISAFLSAAMFERLLCPWAHHLHLEGS